MTTERQPYSLPAGVIIAINRKGILQPCRESCMTTSRETYTVTSPHHLTLTQKKHVKNSKTKQSDRNFPPTFQLAGTEDDPGANSSFYVRNGATVDCASVLQYWPSMAPPRTPRLRHRP